MPVGGGGWAYPPGGGGLGLGLGSQDQGWPPCWRGVRDVAGRRCL